MYGCVGQGGKAAADSSDIRIAVASEEGRAPGPVPISICLCVFSLQARMEKHYPRFDLGNVLFICVCVVLMHIKYTV